MIWFSVFFLFLAQVPEPAPSPGLPEAAGVYFRQDNTNWTGLRPAVVLNANAKGMDLFVYTGGYTDLGMNIACRGPRATMRILLPKPMFYVRGIGPAKDAMLIRLTEKKDSRVFKTSFSNVTVENKGGYRKGDISKLDAIQYPDGSFSVSPEKALAPGEYLLVFSSASTAYDFGIDKANRQSP